MAAREGETDSLRREEARRLTLHLVLSLPSIQWAASHMDNGRIGRCHLRLREHPCFSPKRSTTSTFQLQASRWGGETLASLVAYVSFSSSDLYNWKTPSPPFSEKSLALTVSRKLSLILKAILR